MAVTERIQVTPHSFTARRRWTGVCLTAPAVAGLALTAVFPLAWTIAISVLGFGDAGRGSGADNYMRIVGSPGFSHALAQTLGYVATTLTVELVIGLPVALALQRGTRARRLLRVIISLPLMVAPVVGALAFRFMFSSDYGLINHALATLGLPTPLWLADVWLARIAILLANLWLALPFVVLVLLAGLANIPEELAEAARTDGAGRWRTFVHVTLPLLRPAILIILVIRLADAFRIFDAVYVLTGGGPANTTEVMSSYLYRVMFTRGDFAGAAAATVLFVAVIAISAAAIFLLLRGKED